MATITTKIDQRMNVRLHKVAGVLTKEELLRKLDEIYSSPDIPTEINVLWDLREADLRFIDLSDVPDVKNFSEANWGTDSDSRAALIINKDQYGLTRLYQALFKLDGHPGVKLFYDLDEGLEWAGGKPSV